MNSYPPRPADLPPAGDAPGGIEELPKSAPVDLVVQYERRLAQLAPWCYRLLAVVMLFAAVMKTVALPPESREGMFRVPWILALIVLIETLIGGWLAFAARFFPRATRQWGALLFLMLAIYSLVALVRGESCQCFGSSYLSSAIPLGIDVWAICMLAILPTQPRYSVPLSQFARGGLALSGVLGIGLASWVMGTAPVELRSSAQTIASARTVAIHPARWLGQPLPIGPYVDLARGVESVLATGAGEHAAWPGMLGHGLWLVMLYHHDCPHCHRVIGALRRLSEAQRSSYRLAIVDVAPDAPEPERLPDDPSWLFRGRLALTKRWVLTPPLGILLNDGQVTANLTADELEQWHGPSSPPDTLVGDR